MRLRRRIAAAGLPDKATDRNLLIGSWNIRHLSRVYLGVGRKPRQFQAQPTRDGLHRRDGLLLRRPEDPGGQGRQSRSAAYARRLPRTRLVA